MPDLRTNRVVTTLREMIDACDARLLASAALLAVSTAVMSVAGSLLLGRTLEVSAFDLLSVVFNFVLFLVVLFAAMTIRNAGLRRLGLGALYGATTLFVFAYVYHYALYRQSLGDPSIAALLDSNPAETQEFLRWALDPAKLGLAVACAVAAAAALIVTRPVHSASRHVSSSPLTLGLLSVALLAFGFSSREISRLNPLLFTPRAVAHTMLYKAKAKAWLENVHAADVSSVRALSPDAETHIFVIGESTTSRHMSIYGYPRQTNPALGAMRGELLLAKDACSSRSTTAPSLQDMLTFANREDAKPLLESANLLQIMRAAGYKIFWLSNQQMYGRFDNWSGLLSKAAQVREFVNKVGWTNGASNDEALLPPLDAALADPAPRKLIVLHLLGAHAEYEHRYPPTFAKFDGFDDLGAVAHQIPAGAQAAYNAYDNAVLYNDHVVASIVARARKSGAASVSYLSDHGEALGETDGVVGHLEDGRVRQMFEIPLVFWLSDAALARRASQIDTLRANLGKPWQADETIHTLLDLYRVSHEAWRSEESLLSPTYTPKARYCDTLPKRPARLAQRAGR